MYCSRFLGTQCFWVRSSTWLGFPKFLCIRRTGHWIIRGLVTFLVCPPPHQLVSFPLCGLIFLCAKVSVISQLLCPTAHPLPPAQSWSWGYCPALSCWLGLQTCGTMKERPISRTAEEWGRLSRAPGGAPERFGLESRLWCATLGKLLNVWASFYLSVITLVIRNSGVMRTWWHQVHRASTLQCWINVSTPGPLLATSVFLLGSIGNIWTLKGLK